MFATLWAIFRNIFYFRGVLGLWSGLSWWVGVVCGRLFFCEGWKWRKCRLGGEKRMKWCRCDANEEDDFFAINNWFSG